MHELSALFSSQPNVSFWPILLKKSRREFCPQKSVVDVEIWFAQKAELSWILRSNAKIE